MKLKINKKYNIEKDFKNKKNLEKKIFFKLI